MGGIFGGGSSSSRTPTPPPSNNGGGGGNNNSSPAPTPTPTPTPTPDPVTPESGETGGTVTNPNIFLLQREQRNRRLGRNYFSLLGVSEQFTGARRNSLL